MEISYLHHYLINIYHNNIRTSRRLIGTILTCQTYTAAAMRYGCVHIGGGSGGGGGATNNNIL